MHHHLKIRSPITQARLAWQAPGVLSISSGLEQTTSIFITSAQLPMPTIAHLRPQCRRCSQTKCSELTGRPIVFLVSVLMEIDLCSMQERRQSLCRISILNTYHQAKCSMLLMIAAIKLSVSSATHYPCELFDLTMPRQCHLWSQHCD